MSDNFSQFLNLVLIPALGKTLYMVIISTIIASILGFILAIVLIVTDRNGLKPNRVIYSILDFIINIFRSFPFIILIVAIIPLTRFIAGKSIGETAALVPLTIGAAPFIARVIEGALKEVDKGLIEAAKSFGASDMQIIFRVMVKEALPSIISGITLSIISILGYSAMAGAVGAGGLGAVALTYGYQRFDNQVMFYTVFTLIVLVQILQSIGNVAYKKLR
ncbi:methionine ABC transporter permease [Clostridium folliculivorans]|uniref:Methionine ABC transporter permease n=1 Tax=Clostridium folliculivorans TaxID=2886038 RepID=A0A9W5XYR6_9CLOT|nr:methionine ABC transporter permease [Clostridium folliculivorans]GKU23422.1 methionine ABC transporter permease [Clostridium folliculivorans]GKU29539.1 methionine ABC transporter permease [Clostridium folliculivorans]